MKSLRCKVYRHRKVLSIKRAINLKITHECGCGRSLPLLDGVHTPQTLLVKVGQHHSMAARKANRGGGTESRDGEKLLLCANFCPSFESIGLGAKQEDISSAGPRRAYTRIIWATRPITYLTGGLSAPYAARMY